MTVSDWRARYRFDVFVSYSRNDTAFALKLVKALSEYTAPRDIYPEGRRLRVFLDQNDLAGVEYQSSIEENLRASWKLLVICSPSARVSPYVDGEIRDFRSLHADRDLITERAIIPLLLSGIPNNKVTEETRASAAFPQALFPAELIPLAADYRDIDPERQRPNRMPFESAWHKLLADTYNREPAEIAEREKRRMIRRRNTLIAGLSAAILVLSALSAFAFYSRSLAVAARNEALRARQAEAEQKDKAVKAAEAERLQRIRSQTDESRLLADLSRTQADRGNGIGAALFAIQALPADKEQSAGRPVVDESVRALQDSLHAYAASRLIWTFEGHGGQRDATSELDDVRKIYDVSFSPDSKRVLTASPDATARVLDVTTGNELFQLRHTFDVYTARYSPDGRYIVTGSKDGLAGIWSAENGGSLSYLNHWQNKDCGGGGANITSQVFSVSISRDSQHVLTSAMTGKHLWSVASLSSPSCEGSTEYDSFDETGTYARSVRSKAIVISRVRDAQPWLSFDIEERDLRGGRFSAHGRRFVIGFADGRVEAWDLDAKTKTILQIPQDEHLFTAEFDGRDQPVALTASDTDLHVWDVQQAKPLISLPGGVLGPGAELTSYAIGSRITDVGLPSGQFFFALANRGVPGLGGRGYLIDEKAGNVTAVLSNPNGAIVRAAFSPDGKRLATGSDSGIVSFWDSSFPDIGNVAQKCGGRLVSLDYFPASPAAVLSGCSDGSLRAVDIEQFKSLITVNGGPDGVADARVSADGNYVLARTDTGALQAFAGSRSFRLPPELGEVLAASFAGTSHLILVGLRDGSVRKWDVSKGKADKLMQAQARTTCAGLSSGRSYFFSCHGDPLVRRDDSMYIWPGQKPELAVTLHAHTLPLLGGAIREDVSRVLTWGADGRVILWDLKAVQKAAGTQNRFLQEGQEIAAISVAKPQMAANTFRPARVTATFNHAGSRFVAVGETAEVRNSTNGSLISHLRGHSGVINAAVFSADDRLLATAGNDMTVRVWNPESGAEISVLRGHTRQINALAFVGPKQKLISASDDGTLRVWEMKPDWRELVEKAHRILPRWKLTPTEELLVAPALPR
jgi:WD40 repeat protein